MSDSIKKWEELCKAERDRQRVVAQNGPSGLHYDDTDEDIELAPAKDWTPAGECPLTFTATNTGTISGNTSDSIFIEDSNPNVTHGYFDHLNYSVGGCPSHYLEEDTSTIILDTVPSGTVISRGFENHTIDALKYSLQYNKDDKEDNSQPDFKKVTDSIADLLKYKNIKYGNSALEPMDIFQGKCKVGQRLDDKLARVKNGDSLKKNDVADLIGYLTLVCVEKKWDNFDEFMD